MFIFDVGGHLPPPAGPAHWSTTVTVTPECRSQLRNGSNQRNGNGDTGRFTAGATELHRQITLPTHHINGNGHQNGNGHGKDINSYHGELHKYALFLKHIISNISYKTSHSSRPVKR